MKIFEIVLETFPFLKSLEHKEFIFSTSGPSLAEVIAKSDLLYKPGVYIIYSYNNRELGNLLYVGMAGADKEGNINSHQLPKRLLAVAYPPVKYLNKMPSKHTTRNDAWPIMMKMDNINAIKVFCFFSPIKKDFKVHESAIPINLERSINKILIEKGINQPWSKRHA